MKVPNTGTNEQQKSTESQSDSEKSKTEASKTDNNPKKPDASELDNQTPSVIDAANNFAENIPDATADIFKTAKQHNDGKIVLLGGSEIIGLVPSHDPGRLLFQTLV